MQRCLKQVTHCHQSTVTAVQFVSLKYINIKATSSVFLMGEVIGLLPLLQCVKTHEQEHKSSQGKSLQRQYDNIVLHSCRLFTFA